MDKDGEPLKQSSQSIVGYLESLQLFYTPNNELEKSIKIHQQGFDVTTTTTNYYYDAFGRRIGKSSSTQKSSKLNQRGQLVRFPSNLSSLNTTDRPQRKNMLMLWDGNRQIQEYTDEQIFTTVYEQGSFEPVARVVQLSEILEKQRIDNAVTHVWQYVPSGIVTQDVLDNVEKAKQPLVKIYHYHCNHLGTPQELSDENGNIIWLSYDRAWGGSFDTIYKQQFIDNFALKESELQPIKFQGQSLDVETGLHYNRFRYYDSDVGMFIQRDPIGLLGGNNVFQYAPNPVQWTDPWGLSCTKAKPTKYHKRTVNEVEKMRKTFEKSGGRREKFLKHLAKQPDALEKYGKDALEKMQKGKVPDGMVVHHKKPLFRGGNNRNSNLDLINEKYHKDNNKALHWYEEGQNPYGLN